MSEISLRRKRATGRKFKGAKMAVCFPLGEFRIYELAIKLLDFDLEKQAVMFHINKAEKRIRIEVEDKQDDNYHFNDAKGYHRFTSKNLAYFFSENMGLEPEGNYYFDIKKENENVFATLSN